MRQRLALESSMGDSVNEIILMNADGGLPEGTQTNFFALHEGNLVTAGTGVLEGTVRKLVLQVCAEHGIPVRLETPNICDITAWDGAFISSTSRLLLPVDYIDVQADGHEPAGFPMPRSGLADRVAELVLGEVLANSEPVLKR